MSATTISSVEDLTWRPRATELERSRILDFARTAGCSTVSELTAKADEQPAWFWGAVSEWLGLEWQKQPTAVLDQLEEPHTTKWFIDGAFNISDNAVDRWIRAGRGGETALRWELEDGTVGSYTFTELAAEVERVSRGLLHAGISFGDTVGMQLPMVAEAVVAQLACARIGAVLVPIFSGYGSSAVGDRLRLSGAVAHIVADGFDRRGRTVALREETHRTLQDCPTVRTTIVVHLASSVAGPELPGELDWESLGNNSKDPVPAAICPTDHPLIIAFTSGTTGAPKGVVLSHAGFAVKAGSDAAFSFDIGPGDTAMWITDPGWIMSPITVLGGLIAGSSVAVFAGSPDYPRSSRIWEVVQRLGVTMLGVSPTLIRSLMSQDANPSVVDLGSLRVLASSGEAWTPDAYRWLFEQIGNCRLPIINYSGGTEVSGAILSNTTAQPIHACGFAGTLPGMGADIVDSEGHGIGAGLGELALRRPNPGMPLTFWGAPERYFSTYWSRWPGIWYHGDWVERDDQGIWYVRGRSDDTLKIAGKRVGPAEVEAVVNSIVGVIESAAIGVPDPIKGESLVVFARVNFEAADDAVEIGMRIRQAVAKDLGKPLSPKAVHVVETLPRTRSGKILRRVIRAVYLDEAPGDLSSLEDPAAVEVVKGVSR